MSRKTKVTIVKVRMFDIQKDIWLLLINHIYYLHLKLNQNKEMLKMTTGFKEIIFSL